MITSEIDVLDRRVDQFLRDGATSSASQFISDTVSSLVRSPYSPADDKKYLVHYTTIDALFSLLSCPINTTNHFSLSSASQPDDRPGFLRLYDTLHSNDPNEGQLLVSSTESVHRFTTEHNALWKLLEDRSNLPAYIASFRGVSHIEGADDLVFWRTYATEGKGCALVFPISFIDQAVPVLQVQYGEESKRLALDHFLAVFDGISSAPAIQRHGFVYSGGEVPKYVSSALSPIPYLHKSLDYEFENEVRVVVPYVDLDPNALFGHYMFEPTLGSKLRHFAHIPGLDIMNLLRTNSVLYLGPAVAEKNNLVFVLERRLHHFGLVGTKILASKIDYRS